MIPPLNMELQLTVLIASLFLIPGALCALSQEEKDATLNVHNSYRASEGAASMKRMVSDGKNGEWREW